MFRRVRSSTEHIADVLKRSRLAAGLTQAELARLLGTDQPALSAYENGSKRPSPATVRQILLTVPPRPSVTLERHRDEVRAAVARHHGSCPLVFGSVAEGTDTWSSDLDLLVTFDPDPRRSMVRDLFGLVAELEAYFGPGRVDLHSYASAPPAIRDKAVPI